MRNTMHRAVSAATGTLAVLALTSCDATQLASVTTDRIVPTVSIAIEGKVGQAGYDSVSVRAPLQVKVSASDNAALLKVITRVFADTAEIKADTALFIAASTSLNKTLTVSLAGVRPGQNVTVRTEASDGAGNAASGMAAAVAFDPNVPKMAFAQPAARSSLAAPTRLTWCWLTLLASPRQGIELQAR